MLLGDDFVYKLLIADDEPSIRIGLTHLDWESLRIQIVAAVGNGQDAYNYILQNEVDIVLTDVKMPIMDGLELVRLINELKDREITVVALSGYRDFEYVKHCFKNNTVDYLLKPLDIDEWQSVFSAIVNRLDGKTAASAVGSKGHSKNHLVTSALEYINKNYPQQITLSEVAAHVYSNPTYLSRVLKEETGKGFSDLLTTVRMEAAKSMLKNPSYKINEIAEKTGYTSQRYFTYIFKKYTGRTPYSYRSE